MNTPFDEIGAVDPQLQEKLARAPIAAPVSSPAPVRTAKLKADDLTRRGIAFYTTPTGIPKEITDPTSAQPLTGFDKRNSIAWDSKGTPQKIDFDAKTGDPRLTPAYDSVPDFTDTKTGNVYRAPQGLPWQQTGEDPVIKEKLQRKERDRINRETAQALAPVQREAATKYRDSFHAAKASAKLAAAQFTALGVPLKDAQGVPAMDLLNADANALRSHIESSFNREYGAPEANAKPLFGGGEYSDTATAIRKDIDARKQRAMDTAAAHAAALDQMRAQKTALGELAAQRKALVEERLAEVNMQREQAGLPPAIVPQDLGGTARTESETPQGPVSPFIEAVPAIASPEFQSQVGQVAKSSGSYPGVEGSIPSPAMTPDVPEKPFFSVSDTIGGIWDALSGLGTTAPAAFYQLVEGMERPDKYSDSAKAAFEKARVRSEEMAAKTAARQAAGASSSVGESFREAGDSLGFSLGAMGAAIPAALAGGAVGAKAGAGIALAAGFAGPQAAAPEELVTVPVGAGLGYMVGAGTAAAAASGTAAYRMAGANFMADAFRALDEKSQRESGRPMDESEKQAAFSALLPVAKNTALWEAGPEAVGNAVMLGLGRVALGIGEPVMKSLAKSAMGKAGLRVAAGAGLVGTELATETVTQVEQGGDQRKLQAHLEGRPMGGEAADWSGSGVVNAFKEVAPQTLAITTLMGGGAAGIKAGYNLATRKAESPATDDNGTDPDGGGDTGETIPPLPTPAGPTPEALAEFSEGDEVVHEGRRRVIAERMEHPQAPGRFIVSFTDDPQTYFFESHVAQPETEDTAPDAEESIPGVEPVINSEETDGSPIVEEPASRTPVEFMEGPISDAVYGRRLDAYDVFANVAGTPSSSLGDGATDAEAIAPISEPPQADAAPSEPVIPGIAPEAVQPNPSAEPAAVSEPSTVEKQPGGEIAPKGKAAAEETRPASTERPPEQMSPEEFSKDIISKPSEDFMPSERPQLAAMTDGMRVLTDPNARAHFNLMDQIPATEEGGQKFIRGWVVGGKFKAMDASSQQTIIEIAVDAEKPVSVAAVDTYGIQLPEGYTKKGDLYVYEPNPQKEPVSRKPEVRQDVPEPREVPVLPERSDAQDPQAPPARPADSVEDYVPAIKVGEQTLRGQKGDTHKDILNRYLDANPDDSDALFNFDTKENPNFFLRGDEPVTREQLKAAHGVSDSQGLRKLQTISKPTDTQKASPVPPAEAESAPSSPIESTPEIVKGEKINRAWTAFSPESKSLGIPREEMPQVRSEHRGALANFLKSRGIAWAREDVLPGTLKPTQAEYSPSKVEKAKKWEGEQRAILVSADGHVIDGHHQWMASLEKSPSETMPIVRLDASVKDILSQIHEFPSAGMEKAPEAVAAEPFTVVVRTLDAKGKITEAKRPPTKELVRELSKLKGIYAQLLDCLGRAA